MFVDCHILYYTFHFNILLAEEYFIGFVYTLYD